MYMYMYKNTYTQKHTVIHNMCKYIHVSLPSVEKNTTSEGVPFPPTFDAKT